MNYKRRKQSNRKLRYTRRGSKGDYKHEFQKLIEKESVGNIRDIRARINCSGF
jgi:hypothetical protein